MREEQPTRCIDPVMKYCQGYKYGVCIYPSWVETYKEYRENKSIT